MEHRQIVLASRPQGEPKKENFRFESFTLPNIKEGEVRLKGKFYSVDPYMRGRMNQGKSYVAPFEVGQPLEGAVVAEVIESKSKHFHSGDMVHGRLPWKEEMVMDAKNVSLIDVSVAPASYYLSILGTTGLTAYFGLLDIGEPVKGETVVISGGAGAVGMAVGQIAKIKGCRVVGIAGTDEKIEKLKSEYGFDAGINYKTTDNMKDAVKQACPDGVDIYFDNVGGEISDAVIANINFNARIPLCGQIALYNSTEQPTGPRLQPMLLTRSVKMQGFIVSNYKDRFKEGIEQLAEWYTADKLKFEETRVKGFDKIPDALIGLFHGNNTGKMVVEM